MSVLTISRQFGAGGVTFGRMISNRLGYSFFNNEILQMVARKAKVSVGWVESMEKEAGGKLQRFISGLVPKNTIDRILDDQKGYIDEEIYVNLLNDIILKIANEGNAVILGRGGQYILKGNENTFHVLLVADKAHRVRFIEEKYGLSIKQAVKVVNIEDKKRINLYRKVGKEDYDQPSHYHLVMNMGELNMEDAVDLIFRMVQR